MVHGPNATHVGTDSFGNKYYTRMTEQYGASPRRALKALNQGAQATPRSYLRVRLPCASVPRLAFSLTGCGCGLRAGRHRWVVYGDLNWPSGQDPTCVPPEWHGTHALGFALCALYFAL